MGSHSIGRRAGITAAAASAAFGLAMGGSVLPAFATTATLDSTDQCTFPAQSIKGTPWSLQRVLLDELWRDTKGQGVKVAVIDTGVDNDAPQLAKAVDAKDGLDLIKKGGDGTTDPVGHGTKAAGIIAARPDPKHTGFVGIAPEATIIPIRQNDGQEDGDSKNNTTTALAAGIHHAVERGAKVINISQDAPVNVLTLQDAVEEAVAADVVVVASAGNNGTDGKSHDTYPAAYPGVLAVGASDRNNERAQFSQSGEFVGVAAPGVDMVSTVPKGGQCLDNGTSFSAPYVAGVAALIRAKHPSWTAPQVIAQIEETAQRTDLGHNRFVGWGVVDPVAALNEDDHPIEEPSPDVGVARGEPVVPAALTVGETQHDRDVRTATFFVAGGVVSVLALAGGSVTLRDWRRRRAAL